MSLPVNIDLEAQANIASLRPQHLAMVKRLAHPAASSRVSPVGSVQASCIRVDNTHLGLNNAVNEDWQVVMQVHQLQLRLPLDAILAGTALVNQYGQVAPAQ